MQTQTPLTRCRHDVTGAIAPLPKRGWRLASNPPGRGRFSALRSLSPALQRRATQRAGAWHPTRRSEGASAPFVRSARRFSAGRRSGTAGARALQRRAGERRNRRGEGASASGGAAEPPERGRFSVGRHNGRAPGIQPAGARALQRRAAQRNRRSEGASAPFVRSARRFSAGRHSGQAPGIQPAGARALQRRAAQRAGAPGIQPAGARTLQRPSFAQPGASAPGDTADGRPASNPPERGRFSAGRRSGTAGARALQRRATQRDRPDFELGAGMMCETKPCTVHVRTSCGMVKAHGGAC